MAYDTNPRIAKLEDLTQYRIIFSAHYCNGIKLIDSLVPPAKAPMLQEVFETLVEMYDTGFDGLGRLLMSKPLATRSGAIMGNNKVKLIREIPDSWLIDPRNSYRVIMKKDYDHIDGLELPAPHYDDIMEMDSFRMKAYDFFSLGDAPQGLDCYNMPIFVYPFEASRSTKSFYHLRPGILLPQGTGIDFVQSSFSMVKPFVYNNSYCDLAFVIRDLVK